MKIRAGIAQSVQRLATGWTVRGSNPGGGDIFPHLFRTGPGAQFPGRDTITRDITPDTDVGT